MIFVTGLVYLSYVVLFVFATFNIACGLYYLAELIEEFTVLAKRVLKYSILFVLVVHLCLVVFEGFPVLHTLLGIVAHVTYFTLLAPFPYITLTDPKFIISCVLAVVDHSLWFHYFTNSPVFIPFNEILAFFVFCVWLVPFGFFVSLSANDNALPIRPDGGQTGASPAGPRGTGSGKGRQSVITAFFDNVKRVFSSLVPERLSSASSKLY